MTTQASRDKVLWELAAHGRMMKKDLRRRSVVRLPELEPILEELEKEGRIRIDARNMINLK